MTQHGDTVDSRSSEKPTVSYLQLLIRYPDLRRLYLSRIISDGGDWFATVVLLGFALENTNSTLATSMVVVASTVPAVLAAPMGGLLADRVNRRWLMLSCQIVSALLVLLMIPFSATGTLWGTLACMAALAAVSALYEPAAAAVMPNMVRDEDLSRANALMGSVWGIMIIVGAGLGGVVSAMAGRQSALLIDAVSFLISAILLLRMSHSPFARSQSDDGAHHDESFGAIAEGVRYIVGNPDASSFVALRAAFGLQAGILVVLSVYGTRLAHGTDLGIGLLVAGRGVGSLIGAYLAGLLALRFPRRLLLMGAVGGVAFGLCYVLFPHMPHILLATLVVIAAQCGSAVGYTLGEYGLQQGTPDWVRGRVMAAEMSMMWIMIVLSAVLFGWVFEVLSPTVAVTLFGLFQVIIGLALVVRHMLIHRTGIATDTALNAITGLADESSPT